MSFRSAASDAVCTISGIGRAKNTSSVRPLSTSQCSRTSNGTRRHPTRTATNERVQHEHESPTVVARQPAAAGKPRFALFVATACGLGYLPKAPGTWGSLGGLVLAVIPWWALYAGGTAMIAAKRGEGSFFLVFQWHHMDLFLCAQVALTFLAAAIGVWSADRAAQVLERKGSSTRRNR